MYLHHWRVTINMTLLFWRQCVPCLIRSDPPRDERERKRTINHHQYHQAIKYGVVWIQSTISNNRKSGKYVVTQLEKFQFRICESLLNFSHKWGATKVILRIFTVIWCIEISLCSLYFYGIPFFTYTGGAVDVTLPNFCEIRIFGERRKRRIWFRFCF